MPNASFPITEVTFDPNPDTATSMQLTATQGHIFTNMTVLNIQNSMTTTTSGTLNEASGIGTINASMADFAQVLGKLHDWVNGLGATLTIQYTDNAQHTQATVLRVVCGALHSLFALKKAVPANSVVPPPLGEATTAANSDITDLLGKGDTGTEG
jgi:hypothetical protein